MNSSTDLKILLVCVEFPFPANNGVRLRNSYLLRALVELGHAVTLATFSHSTEADILPSEFVGKVFVRQIPRKLASLSTGGDYMARLLGLLSPTPFSVSRFESTQMRHVIDEEHNRQAFDLILCDTDFSAVNLTHLKGTPVLLSHHNAEHLILSRYAQRERNLAKRAYASIEATKMRNWAKKAASLAQCHIVCSDNDRAEFIDLGIDPIFVVPNIFEATAERGAVVDREPRTLIFQGGMDWLPNRDAVQFFASKILPKISSTFQEVQLIVAGRVGPSEFIKEMKKYPQVTFTGTVEDMSRYIRRAALSVVPLRIGSGTRLKILEASSYGVPVVSTSIGAEGLKFVNGSEILIADQPEDFAQAVARLLRDDELRDSLGAAAKIRVETDYSMNVFRQTLRTAIEDMRLGDRQFRNESRVTTPVVSS
jgi:glycosyltransferase involved in cell wall biosynthesis